MTRRIGIIGGGVIGCSVAWHLAARELGDIVLLERHSIGAGTTWHSAGNITWKPLPAADAPIAYMLDEVVPRVAKESDLETGWLTTGRLFLARSERTATSFEAQAAAAQQSGHEFRPLSAAEATDFHPLLNPSGLAGIWFNARSGRLDPAGLTAAYARAARNRGATVREGCAVRAILTRNGQVSGVATGDGDIALDAVVVCCGLWSRRVLAPLDIALGQWGCEHFYIIARTDPRPPRTTPSFVTPDDSLYGREEVGGLLFGCFDADALTLDAPDGAPSDGFAFSLLDENWTQFGPYAERAQSLFPALRDAPVQRFVNGPETFTPDGQPLIGPLPEVEGLFVASALSSAGVTYSGMTGSLVADQVAGIEPRFDASRYRPERFADRARDEAWLRQRVSGAPSSHYLESNV